MQRYGLVSPGPLSGVGWFGFRSFRSIGDWRSFDGPIALTLLVCVGENDHANGVVVNRPFSRPARVQEAAVGVQIVIRGVGYSEGDLLPHRQREAGRG